MLLKINLNGALGTPHGYIMNECLSLSPALCVFLILEREEKLVLINQAVYHKAKNVVQKLGHNVS